MAHFGTMNFLLLQNLDRFEIEKIHWWWQEFLFIAFLIESEAMNSQVRVMLWGTADISWPCLNR